MGIKERALLKPNLEHNCFYWVKLNPHTIWQPGLYDDKLERFKLLVGGYKNLTAIDRVDLEPLKRKKVYALDI